MYAEERQQAIAAEIRALGRVSVTELSAQFEVTGETIRRDLAVLERGGMLQRVHGGAVRPDAVAVTSELGLAERQVARTKQKTAIGVRAMELLPPAGGAVIFDAGTTTYQAALALPSGNRLTLVTNSIPVASVLVGHRRSTVNLLGGPVRGLTQACVGADTVRALGRMRASVAFMGVNGISLAHGLSTPDPDEAATKRAMVGAATRVVVLADSSKIGREVFAGFADLSKVDVLVTDEEVDPAFVSALTARDIEVVIA